jgi:hypothetical protein
LFGESRSIRGRGVSYRRCENAKRNRERNRVERAGETIFFGRRRNERTRFEREATASFVDFIRRRRRKKRNRAFFLRKKLKIFSRKTSSRFVGANRSAAQIRSAAQKKESARRRPRLAKNKDGSDFRFFENKRRDGFFRRIAKFLRVLPCLRRLPSLTPDVRR